MFIDHFVVNLEDYEITKARAIGLYARMLFQADWETHQVLTSKNVVASAICELNAGKKFYSHWHVKNEEIFYLLSGNGIAILDDFETTISLGSIIYVPLKALHTMINYSEEPMRYLTFEITTHKRTKLEIEKCVQHINGIKKIEYYGAKKIEVSKIFWPENKESFSQVEISAGKELKTPTDINYEEFWYIISGRGNLTLCNQQKRVYAGSTIYIPSGLPNSITADNNESLTIIIMRMPSSKDLSSSLHEKLIQSY